MMKKTKCKCPKCQKIYEISYEMIGKKTTCKSCGHKFKITTNTAPRIQAEPIQKEDRPALRNPDQVTQGKNLSNAKQIIHHGKVGMWDIKSKYLQENEAIEYTDCPSMLSCIFAYIWAGYMIFGAMVNLIISIWYNTNMTSKLLLYSLLLALPAIYVILRRLSTRYARLHRDVAKLQSDSVALHWGIAGLQCGVANGLRKVIKTKGAFPGEASVMKIFYLALENIAKKWTMPIRCWSSAMNQFAIKFGDRVRL